MMGEAVGVAPCGEYCPPLLTRCRWGQRPGELERRGDGWPPAPPQGTQFHGHLDFSPGWPSSEVWPLESYDSKFIVKTPRLWQLVPPAVGNWNTSWLTETSSVFVTVSRTPSNSQQRRRLNVAGPRLFLLIWWLSGYFAQVVSPLREMHYGDTRELSGQEFMKRGNLWSW